MEAMTPIPPERVEIDGVNILEYLDLMKEKGLSWPHADAQIRYILSDYSALKAENEALVKRCEELFYNVTEGEWLAKVESYTKLEAENERLREDNNYFHAGFDSVREDYEEQKARAEKAEAELVAANKELEIRAESHNVAMAEVERLREDCDRTADVVVEQMAQLAKQAPLIEAVMGAKHLPGIINNLEFLVTKFTKFYPGAPEELAILRAALALREGEK
jgi:chromosome segregation ATPase